MIKRTPKEMSSGSDTEPAASEHTSSSSLLRPLEAYELNEWDPKEAFGGKAKQDTPFNILLVGPSKSGKSVFLRDMYVTYWERRFDLTVVFSHSIAEGYFQSFVNSRLMYSEWDPDIIQRIVQIQLELQMKGLKPLRVLVIFDDLIGLKVKADKQLNDIFTLGRHFPYNMSICYSTQALTMLNPIWRQQVHYLALFHQRLSIASEKVYEHFLSGIVDEETLRRARCSQKTFMTNLLKQNTLEYHCVVVDYLSVGSYTSTKDMVFQYLASMKPKRRRVRFREDIDSAQSQITGSEEASD
jgi:hypothetical protein